MACQTHLPMKMMSITHTNPQVSNCDKMFYLSSFYDPLYDTMSLLILLLLKSGGLAQLTLVKVRASENL